MWVTPFTYLIMSKHAEQPWNWGVSIHWTGLLDWTTGLDYWTGLLDWTTGLTFLPLKIFFFLCPVISLTYQ